MHWTYVSIDDNASAHMVQWTTVNCIVFSNALNNENLDNCVCVHIIQGIQFKLCPICADGAPTQMSFSSNNTVKRTCEKKKGTLPTKYLGWPLKRYIAEVLSLSS